jgi:response regulator RpfG family c-di-GMP phosphodiesterase
MGLVYLAEHVVMRRRVAVKVLPTASGQDPNLLTRFYSEVRALTRLQHPNIVTALDAGRVCNPEDGSTALHFFVMEYLVGLDLEAHVEQGGPLPPTRACDLVYQVAGALGAAHRQGLIHRDIKPSNVLLTPEGQAKLLDFGLARQFRQRLTDPGMLIGSVDYVAPEQLQDASAVDQRADLYALGGVLYWCLTGQRPCPGQQHPLQVLAERLVGPPPSARRLRPELPAGLDDLMARLMAPQPDDRYPDAAAVAQALLPFLSPPVRDRLLLSNGRAAGAALWAAPRGEGERGRPYRVLLADDDPFTRLFCKGTLTAEGIECAEANDGLETLQVIRERPHDLVLLDVRMPGLTGPEVCRRLREEPPWPNLKIVMLSGCASNDQLAQIMLAGANDFLVKPTTPLQLLARVKSALDLKDAQDRSDALNQRLLEVNHELGQTLQARVADLTKARKGLGLLAGKLCDQRGAESLGHLLRLQRYCRRLAEAAALPGQVDEHFLEALEACAPFHDLGKLCLPDHVLLKPGRLDADERLLMQTHTVMGAETLQELAGRNGFAPAFLQMALEVARHHHERFDGTGYPDGLRGEGIPLAARVLALADAYDAIRVRRPYKPALPHAVAVRKIEEAAGHFDPVLVEAFRKCHAYFEQVFREIPD